MFRSSAKYSLRSARMQRTALKIYKFRRPRGPARNEKSSSEQQPDQKEKSGGAKRKPSGNDWKKDTLMLKNMLKHEKLEKEFATALTSKAVIAVPDVTILGDDEYDKLYPVCFSEMPKDLIVDEIQNDMGDAISPPLQNVTLPENLPIVRVPKIDFIKTLGPMYANVKRFKVLRDGEDSVTVAPIVGPNASDVAFTFPKFM